MGQLVDGVWQKGSLVSTRGGAFARLPTRFHGQVAAGDGANVVRHPLVPGRYHLYVSHACPWAHRTILTRALRGLEHVVSMTVVDPKMGENGWAFTAEDPDPVGGASFLHQVYRRADPVYTGRVTVPVLWDRALGTIVNNESRHVMRMLDVTFAPLATRGESLAPEELRPEIDQVLDRLYEPLNNGVYRAGFATEQAAYESACRDVFAALDHWNAVLDQQRFVCGGVLTEADLALFATLVRFDLVYYAHFKCNVRRIQDYPALWGYLRDIYQRPEVRRVCRLDHVKTHYYWSQDQVNPHRVVPLGPTLDLDAPHDRDRLLGGAR